MDWALAATLGFLAAGGIASGVAVVAWQARPQPGARWLAILLAAGAWWALTASASFQSTTRAELVLWDRLMYLGIGVIPVAWLAFALEYTDRDDWLTPRIIALGLVVPVCTVGIAWLTGIPNPLYAAVEFQSADSIPYLEMTYGWWFWLFVGYTYVLMALGTGLILIHAFKTRYLSRGQAVALVLFAVIPTTVQLLDLSGAMPSEINPTPLAIAGSGTIATVALIRYRLFDVVPIARDTLIDEMPDGVIVFDGDGRVVDFNPVVSDLFDTNENEPIGQPAADIFEQYPALRAPGDEHHSDRTEELVIGDTGQQRHIDVRSIPLGEANGGDTGSLVLLQEVTEQKNYEQRLESLHRAAQELVAAETETDIYEITIATVEDVLQFSPATVFRFDEATVSLQPVKSTANAHEILGEIPTFQQGEGLAWRAFEEGTIKTYEDLHTEGDRYNTESTIRSELLLPLGDHGILIIGSTTAREFTKADRYLGTLLAGTVTAALDRAERERLLKARERELETQNEHLEEFASIVSHDLRNPLNAAQGYTDLAKENGSEDAFERIDRSHDRMEEIIEDVLTLARSGQSIGDTDTVALSTVIRAAWDTIDSETATIEGIDEVDTNCVADETRLQQVFENLFRNAIDHGGADVTIRVGSFANGFFVSDDGSGIDPAERDDIFEMGHSTADFGTGFGLAIVEEIVDSHGWEVTITDGVEGGARFEIRGVNET